MTSNKWLIVLLPVLVVIATPFICHKQQTSLTTTRFVRFNEAAIDNVIEYIDRQSQGAKFKVKGESEPYVFFPRTDKQLNDGHYFSNLAVAGDTVIKKSFSDTLLLIKGHQVYKYTFVKF
jgi:hypothetical protein